MVVKGGHEMDNDAIEKKEKICEYCGEKFLPRRSTQKYCGPICKQKSNRERLKNRIYKYTCQYCGKEYESKVKLKEQFCKEECKRKYEYEKRMAEYEEDLNDNLQKEKNNLAQSVIFDIVNLTVSEIILSAGKNKSAFGKNMDYWKLSDIPEETRKFVLQRDGHKCKVCKNDTELHIHHIIKRAEGGNHSPNNLVTLCASCHRYIETYDINLATKGCYKNALKYYDLEEKESFITFEQIDKELLGIYKKCKNDEKKEALYKISELIDKIEKNISEY